MIPGASSVAVAYARSLPVVTAAVPSTRILSRLMDPAKNLDGRFLVLRQGGMRSQQIPILRFDVDCFAFGDDPTDAAQLIETVIPAFLPVDRKRSTHRVEWLGDVYVFGIYGFDGGLEDVYPFTPSIGKPFSYVRFECSLTEEAVG